MIINLSNGKLKLTRDESEEITRIEFWEKFLDLLFHTQDIKIECSNRTLALVTFAYVLSKDYDDVTFNEDTWNIISKVMDNKNRKMTSTSLRNNVLTARKALLKDGFLQEGELKGEIKLADNFMRLKKIVNKEESISIVFNFDIK